MEANARATRLAEKLTRGLLSTTKPIHRWAGFGNGRPCDGCDDPILGGDVEHEIDFDGGRTVRFHAACAVLWQRTVTLTGIRIVIVEDHEDTRDLLEQVLRHLGATVSAVPCAREALPMVDEADVVITDFALPDEDGVWLLDQVNQGARPIPVIAISGFAEVEEPRLAEAPFVRKLLKPVDPWALGDMIREVVRNGS